jgi:hypothetical protein
VASSQSELLWKESAPFERHEHCPVFVPIDSVPFSNQRWLPQQSKSLLSNNFR